MNLLKLLDPDRNWRAFSTIQHYLSGFILMGIFTIVLKLQWDNALYLNGWTAVVYEGGQTDVAYNTRDGSGQRYAGRPGYGFGLMDISAHMLGSLTFLGVWILVNAHLI